MAARRLTEFMYPKRRHGTPLNSVPGTLSTTSEGIVNPPISENEPIAKGKIRKIESHVNQYTRQEKCKGKEVRGCIQALSRDIYHHRFWMGWKMIFVKSEATLQGA